MLVLEREQKLKLKHEKHVRDMNERCKRIHDVKWTYHGIDKEALEKQVQERKEREELERKANETYEKNWVDSLAKAYELQKKEEEVKRQKEKELVEYRRIHQAPHTRVSYDLNDPCGQKNETFPDREDHHAVGISSVQRMAGHDFNSCNRLKIQQEQNRAWLDQQVLEKKRLKEQNKTSEEYYLQLTLSQQDLIREKMEQEKEQKIIIQRDIIEFNKKLAEEKAKQLREEKCQQIEGDNFIMQSSLGPVLTEDRPVPRSSTGGNRIVGQMYKGFTKKDTLEFRKGLEKQIEEIAKRKELESQSESEWDKEYVKMYKEGLLRAREEERKKKDLLMQNIEENKKMAEEKKALKKETEMQKRSCDICEDFFNQFEKCP